MSEASSNSRAITIKVNYKWLSLILLLIIVGVVAMWRPWQKVNTNRKINVSGEVTLKAEPDEFIFSPSYQRITEGGKSSLDELGKLQKTIVEKIKALGVEDKDIKASTSSYENPKYTSTGPTDITQTTTTLIVLVTIHDKTLADKVQDYLLTTSPIGQITPSAQFSEEKRKALEQEARVKATDDAKSKASLQAKQLDVSLGKVIEVSDGSGFDIIRPLAAKTDMASMPYGGGGTGIQPGQNDFTFTVNVTYALK